ncbi:hypothetical protein Bbelb_348980 [Branchiostoma belcheri]|nr:hypothetical protein Bbelb_348980 [Branchiostoma belcheri]
MSSGAKLCPYNLKSLDTADLANKPTLAGKGVEMSGVVYTIQTVSHDQPTTGFAADDTHNQAAGVHLRQGLCAAPRHGHGHIQLQLVSRRTVSPAAPAEIPPKSADTVHHRPIVGGPLVPGKAGGPTSAPYRNSICTGRLQQIEDVSV